MTVDEKTRFWYRIIYRIFVAFTFIAIGFLFYWIPIANIDTTILTGDIEGLKFGFTLPVLFVVAGALLLTGVFDRTLSFALGFKKALKKAKAGG